MHVCATYAGLYEGTPNADFDAKLVQQARQRAVKYWGERPTHVIPAEYQFETNWGRTFARMPPIEYMAWLTSTAIDNLYADSQLVVIWYGNQELAAGLLDIVSRALKDLPWEQLAGGCDP